jgi:hypothetical protein
MDEPLRYRENRIDGWREFRLVSDTVHIRGKTDWTEYELTVDLKTLDPQFDKIMAQSSYHQWAFVVALACVVGCFCVNDRPPTSPLPMMLFILLGLSVTFYLCTLRKVEHATFKHVSGVAAFSIARAGKDAKLFDGYVQSIIHHIKAVRGLE